VNSYLSNSTFWSRFQFGFTILNHLFPQLTGCRTRLHPRILVTHTNASPATPMKLKTIDLRLIAQERL